MKKQKPSFERKRKAIQYVIIKYINSLAELFDIVNVKTMTLNIAPIKTVKKSITGSWDNIPVTLLAYLCNKIVDKNTYFLSSFNLYFCLRIER